MRTVILVWLVAVVACFVPIWLQTMRLPDCKPPETLRLPPASVLDRAAPRFRVVVVSPDSDLAWNTTHALSQLFMGDSSTDMFSYATFGAATAPRETIRGVLHSADVEAALRKASLAPEETPGLFDIVVVCATDADAEPGMDVGRGRGAWVVAADFAPDSAADIAAAVRAVARPVARCWASVRARVLGTGAAHMRPAREYVLAFTLLFEDGGADSAGRARGWDFAAAEARYLAPLRAALEPQRGPRHRDARRPPRPHPRAPRRALCAPAARRGLARRPQRPRAPPRHHPAHRPQLRRHRPES